MFSKIVCRILGHEFGGWEYVEQETCKQVRVCVRNGHTEHRIAHSFGEWQYVAP